MDSFPETNKLRAILKKMSVVVFLILLREFLYCFENSPHLCWFKMTNQRNKDSFVCCVLV